MIIIDASVGIKWVKAEEQYQKEAVHIYTKHAEGKEEILVPGLFFIEIANSFSTKSSTQPKTIEKDLLFIFKSRLNVYEPTNEDILETALEAKKFNTSVYDMLYAVVAKKHKTILVTADEKFVTKTKFTYVKLLSE